MIDFDATSGDTGTGDLGFTHTPAGTPAGVLGWCVYPRLLSGTSEVNGLTYGGVTVPEVVGPGAAPDSPLLKTGSEPAILHAFLLGSGVPPGMQPVALDANATGSNKRLQIVTLTANGTIAVEDTDTLDTGSTTAPAVTLATSVETAVFGALFSAVGTPANVTPGGNYTELAEIDFGPNIASIVRRTSNAPAGSPVVDWTQTADAAGVFALALREVAVIGEDSLNPGGGDGSTSGQRIAIATYTV